MGPDQCPPPKLTGWIRPWGFHTAGTNQTVIWRAPTSGPSIGGHRSTFIRLALSNQAPARLAQGGPRRALSRLASAVFSYSGPQPMVYQSVRPGRVFIRQVPAEPSVSGLRPGFHTAGSCLVFIRSRLSIHSQAMTELLCDEISVDGPQNISKDAPEYQ